MAVLPTGFGSATNGGYQIERSLRFNSADSASLSRTPASAGNKQTWTLSFWFKTSTGNFDHYIAEASTNSSTDRTPISFNGGKLNIRHIDGSATQFTIETTQLFRDPSAWYHFVIAIDTTQATSTNRVKVYVNGSQITAFGTATYPTQNLNTDWNGANVHRIGSSTTPDSYAGMYLTEFYNIDGQALTPSDFGETDTNTGVWKPKAYTGTYGTNGFYLKFADNSNTTAATLGKDSSGNGNNWTPNNFSVTAGAGNDSLVDSPTSYGTDTGVGGTVRGNYATLNPLDEPATYAAAGSSANGNLDFSVSNDAAMGSTISVSSGKWYWEMTVVSGHSSGSNTVWTAITSITPSSSNKLAWQAGSGSRSYATTGLKYNENTNASYGNTYTNGDVIGCALDLDNGKVYWSKNGTFQASGDPVAGTNAAYTGLTGSWMPEATQNGAVTAWNFGQRAFAYTAPSGFKALCTQNLPTPTIGATSTTQANDYFNVKTWTATGARNVLTGVGFQPSLIWGKKRSAADSNVLVDAVRGVTKELYSDTTGAEATNVNGVESFDSDGFTLVGSGSGSGVWNGNTGATHVAWLWRANGTGSSNTDGSITSTVSASTTSGFSIVTYTGNGSAGATVGHGLGVAPDMVIAKQRSSSGEDWIIYNRNLPSASYTLSLNSTAGQDSTNFTTWNGTAPSSTLITLGSSDRANASGVTYVAYCFDAVAGYSAFGSYTGNGSTDGPFVYTGFRPRWIMFKRSDGVSAWEIVDTARSTYNVMGNVLFPNYSNAEGTTGDYANLCDALSNGFKIRSTSSASNSGTVIYAAFAESPFKYSLAR